VLPDAVGDNESRVSKARSGGPSHRERRSGAANKEREAVARATRVVLGAGKDAHVDAALGDQDRAVLTLTPGLWRALRPTCFAHARLARARVVTFG
jgi:hypothetical protein